MPLPWVGPGPKVRIDKDGKVGIGVTPAYDLHMEKTSGNVLLMVKTRGPNDLAQLRIETANPQPRNIHMISHGDSAPGNDYGYPSASRSVISANHAPLTLGTHDNYHMDFGANLQIRMTIAKDGWVGIGTSTPGHPFHP